MSGNTGSVGSTGSVDSSANTLAQDLEVLYGQVQQSIALAVAGNHFTFDTFEVIVNKVITTIHDFEAAKSLKLTDSEKKNLLVQLLKKILDDLHNNGKLTDQLYNGFNVAVDYVAPFIFSAAMAAYNKLHAVEEDIHTNGCHGCFTRNFKKR
jgi:hypothetical protein